MDSASVGTDSYYIEPAAKALVAGKLIAIFHPRDGKS